MKATPATEQMKVDFTDGSTTELTVFRTGGSSDPVVLCLPAMGVRSGYYELLADSLVEEGFNTVLADLRGSGSSSVRASRRQSYGYADSLELELPAIADSLSQEFGVDQIIVLGHSLGGQLGLMFAARTARVSRVITIASGSSWYRRMPGVRSVGRFLGLQLVFGTTLLYGYLPEWFPFAGREGRHIILDWGYEAMTGRYRISRSSVDYETLLTQSTVPSMFLVFPADPLLPRSCTEQLAAKLESCEVAWREIPPSLVGLTKSDHFRWVFRPKAVAQTVAEWVRPA